jgi:hypothetical protein
LPHRNTGFPAGHQPTTDFVDETQVFQTHDIRRRLSGICGAGASTVECAFFACFFTGH